MIISHEKRFVFFRIPKTGSTTAQVMLRMSSAFDLDKDIITSSEQWLLPHRNVPMVSQGRLMNPHITPKRLVEEGILTEEQLHDYDCYAFCRPVRSRFISAYIHDKGPYARQPSTFMKHVREGNKRTIIEGVLGRPQVDYFFLNGEQIARPLNFKEYEQSLHFLIYKAGGYAFKEIPKINVTGLNGRHDQKERQRWAKTIWNFDEVHDFIMEEYADDHAFWRENFGEEDIQEDRSLHSVGA